MEFRSYSPSEPESLQPHGPGSAKIKLSTPELRKSEVRGQMVAGERVSDYSKRFGYPLILQLEARATEWLELSQTQWDKNGADARKQKETGAKERPGTREAAEVCARGSLSTWKSDRKGCVRERCSGTQKYVWRDPELSSRRKNLILLLLWWTKIEHKSNKVNLTL